MLRIEVKQGRNRFSVYGLTSADRCNKDVWVYFTNGDCGCIKNAQIVDVHLDTLGMAFNTKRDLKNLALVTDQTLELAY